MRRTYIDRTAEYYESMAHDFIRPVRWLNNGPQVNAMNERGERQMRILVVDDERNIRENFSRYFSYKGFSVWTASNAVEAREILMSEDVDVVLLDINMAEVGGEELFEVLKAFHKTVKVVVASVYPVDEQRERVKNADAYYDKSDSREILLGILGELS